MILGPLITLKRNYFCWCIMIERGFSVYFSVYNENGKCTWNKTPFQNLWRKTTSVSLLPSTSHFFPKCFTKLVAFSNRFATSYPRGKVTRAWLLLRLKDSLCIRRTMAQQSKAGQAYASSSSGVSTSRRTVAWKPNRRKFYSFIR